MESGDEDGGIPDNIIEKVARANNMDLSHAPVLPEIRAAPCPMHAKGDHVRSVVDETTNSIIGSVTKPQRRNRHMHPTKSISMQQNHTSHDHAQVRGNRFDINVRIPEQFPTTKSPALPKNMSSKDYVMTWLIHGSAPPGSNHFPEIIPSQNKVKNKSKIKTYTSE